MKKIYTEIAGIKILFELKDYPNEGPAKSITRLLFQRDLNKYLKPFESASKFRSYNYKITFESDITYPEGLRNEGNNIYSLVIKNATENMATVFYHIGIFQFHYILHNIIDVLLSKKGGFSIHSSAVFNGLSADLFLGESGAGKTTISNLLNVRFRKLSDDTSVIRRKGHYFYYFDCPELGKNYLSGKASSYRVRNVYILKKDTIFKIEALSSEEAIEIMLKSVKIVTTSSISTVMDFVKTLKNVDKLHFSKNKQELLSFYKGLNK